MQDIRVTILFIFATCVVSVSTAAADLVTISITQASAGQLIDPNGGSPTDGVFTNVGTVGGTLTVTESPGSIVERFGLEFSLAAIPSNATVTSAVFSASEVYDGGLLSEIYAFVGSGVVGVSDLFNTSNLVGTSSNGPGNGILDPTFPLNVTTFVQSLISSHSTFLGLAFSASPTPRGRFAGYGIYNGDNAGPNIDPTLAITYDTAAVPEASAFAAMALVTLFSSAAVWIHRRSKVVAASAAIIAWS
jgi:hypothetical protein